MARVSSRLSLECLAAVVRVSSNTTSRAAGLHPTLIAANDIVPLKENDPRVLAVGRAME
jgi:hypothetical protein